MSNTANYYNINSKALQRHYKQVVSGFKDWDQFLRSEDYLIYPENITAQLSTDEVSLSKGELYTFVTNKNTRVKNKQSIVAVINGTKAKIIEAVLKRISLGILSQLQELSIGLAVKNIFPNGFHGY